MTLEEFYNTVGGDYADVTDRLCGEEIALEFLFRFADEPLFERLQQAIYTKNQEEAFTIIHTLKGTCVNMGFGNLYSSANRLTEALRETFSPEIPTLFEALEKDYRTVVNSIRALQGK